ncbi:MAG: primosomal protein N' [Lachnospiraceae bacterium]|nr:primosomal protein N' [Lachnospiraceae bacterium]
MEGKYADIIVDISHEKVDRPFQYCIPEKLRGRILIGMEVTIPFGRGNSTRSGYVIAITDQSSFEESKLKSILGIKNDRMGMETDLIRLAAWMREQYGSTMIAALKTVLPVKQKTKFMEKKSVQLKMPEEEAREELRIFQKKHQVARARLLEALLEEKKLSQELVTGKLHVPVKTIQSMEEMGILRMESENVYRNPVKYNTQIQDKIEDKKELSEEQRRIVDEIREDARQERLGTYLIRGITGSGKTEVYMELIQGMITEGKQAIVLIPEIALTYQTLLRFYRRFGDRVSVMNSKLSSGERFDQFERARLGEIDIMIGPRSALFTPFQNLGIIIIDEEHENSYKSETMPRYHAREVAFQIAKTHHAGVVMGSATPSLEAYHMAQSGVCKLYELTKRLTGGTLPTVYTIDLREELKMGNRSIFSRKLQKLIQDRLEKKEQSILFLNRRGYAGFISCRSCGHVMKCPHCDVALSEHRNGKLVCHYCGYEEPMVHKCPECGSPFIAGFKAGTQQIVESLHRLYPEARVLRMDADTTRQKDSYDNILSAFANEEADILVGTQMIVKGHDFPNVTLVGVLAADLSLHANDYRAGERTFQLLTQAVGRAGRGSKAGEAVIQTYQPEHYSVVYAARQDYQGFYQEEMLYREMLRYPPVAQMMVLLISSRTEEAGMELAVKIAGKITDEAGLQVIGPAPATLGKINDIYRTVLYVKHREKEQLIMMKDRIEQYVETLELKNESLQFDFNPMNAY